MKPSQKLSKAFNDMVGKPFEPAFWDQALQEGYEHICVGPQSMVVPPTPGTIAAYVENAIVTKIEAF